MASKTKTGSCKLSAFEKRVYCGKKRVDSKCINPSFLDHRCPYLEMGKKELIKEAKTGSKEIVCLGGFSKEAVVYAERFRPTIRLKDRKSVVKPRRRVKAVAA